MLPRFINELPKSLDETYERILKGIPEEIRSHSQRLLQCLAVAIRPLRVDELAEIFAFEFDVTEGELPTFHADWRSGDQEQEVLSACSSLITIVGPFFRVVQFSHFTVKEYLASDRLATLSEDISSYHILPHAAHKTLAQASLTVLLRLDDHVDKHTARGIPLAEYAAEYWHIHVKDGGILPHIMGAMKTLFDPDRPHLATLVQVHDIDDGNYGSNAKPLYYSVLYGFYDLVEYLVMKHSQDVNAIGGTFGYPLVAALCGGTGEHVRVAELLCQHGANVEAQGRGGRTTLHAVIEWSDNVAVGAVQFLLEHGADVNARREDLSTPLYLAAAKGNFEVAQLLLKHGADVNTQDKNQETPLHLVSDKVNLELVRVLLNYGANVNAKNIRGRTPLHQVLNRQEYNDGAFRIAQLLVVKHNADVNTQDGDHETPLHLVSRNRHLELVQVLLDYGANVNVTNSQGQTPLHQALLFTLWINCFSKRNETVVADQVAASAVALLLVERGAKVNLRDKDHQTPLHLASYGLLPELVLSLLEHGADVHAKTCQGETPFHKVSDTMYCCRGLHDVQVARLLVEHGANVNTQLEHKGQQTPLHLASSCDIPDLEWLHVLLDHGANVNSKDKHGQTPLHLAILNSRDSSRFGVVQLLVEHAADVNAQDEYHQTPLHLASQQKDLKSVKFLLGHGADVRAKNKGGLTPFHQMFESKRREDPKAHFGVAQLLVESNTDVNTRDEVHRTPLHSASYNLDLESAQFLLDNGADVHAEDGQGQTPFYQVFKRLDNRNLYERICDSDYWTHVAKLLVKHGANVNSQKKDHETPLHLASCRRQLEWVRFLLDYGADVHAKNSGGQTPLHQMLKLVSEVAWDNEGFIDVAQLLVKHGAEVNTRDKEHETPLHLASYCLAPEVVRVLLGHGAKVNTKDNRGRTPLHRVLEIEGCYDCENGFAVVQQLTECGADVNTPYIDHETPLHQASRLLSLDVAWVLLKHGAEINVENKDGKTPFQLVRESLREEMKQPLQPLSEYSASVKRARLAQGVELMGLLYSYLLVSGQHQFTCSVSVICKLITIEHDVTFDSKEFHCPQVLGSWRGCPGVSDEV